MINEVRQDRPGNARFFKCPSAITSGMPVLIGTLAAVAMDAYDSTLGGTVFRLSGTFALTVTGSDTTSTGAVKQINRHQAVCQFADHLITAGIIWG